MKKPKKAPATRYSKGWKTRRKNAKDRQRQRDREINLPTLTVTTKAEIAKAPIVKSMTTEGINEMMKTRAIPTRQAVAPRDAERPGQGEIVGGELSQLVDQIAAEIRKAGGKDVAQKLIQQHVSIEQLNAQTESERRMRRLFHNERERQGRRIVCGFLAEVRMAEQRHSNTGLPDGLVFTIPAVTIVKIVDALNKAGYRYDGFTDLRANEISTSVDS